MLNLFKNQMLKKYNILFQVRISYVDSLSKREERQSDLWSTYYFICDCNRCTEEENIETAALCETCHSAVCSNEVCLSY